MVSPEWLRERGGLHDARVIAVRIEVGLIALEVDNEWANENEQSIRGGGELRFFDAAAVEGELSQISGGWISEIEASSLEIFILSFCDRGRVVIKAKFLEWAPTATFNRTRP